MGARQGQNNFGTHQRMVADGNLRKVQAALAALPRRTKYEDFGALLNAVAGACGLHATTLRRNERYVVEILGFLADNPGLVLKPEEDVAPRAALAAKALRAGIEADLLKRDNARLRKLIERQGVDARLQVFESPGGDAGDFKIAFERTAAVLGRLLAHLADEEFGIVVEGSAIRNMAQVGDRSLIAGPPDTTPFIGWLRKQARMRDRQGE